MWSSSLVWNLLGDPTGIRVKTETRWKTPEGGGHTEAKVTMLRAQCILYKGQQGMGNQQWQKDASPQAVPLGREGAPCPAITAVRLVTLPGNAPILRSLAVGREGRRLETEEIGVATIVGKRGTLQGGARTLLSPRGDELRLPAARLDLPRGIPAGLPWLNRR